MNSLRALLFATCVSLAGCQTAEMAVSPSLSAAGPYAVRGANPRIWNAPLEFGPFATANVDEGWTWGFGARLRGVEARYAEQPYRLALVENGAAAQAECVTRSLLLARKDLSVDPTFGALPALSCAFAGAAGEGMLDLQTTASNAENGEASFLFDRWRVRSVMTFAGSSIRSPEPIGYEIARNGETIAAVETINSGRVWLSPQLNAQERLRAAMIAAVLLLYRPAET